MINRVIKYFLIIIMLPVFLLSSTGFIIQKYFCNTCNFEYKELVILEIKESSHIHHDCNVCIIEHGACSCSINHDNEPPQIDYFSLENLFSSVKNYEESAGSIKIVTKFALLDFFKTLSRFDKKIELKSLPPPEIKLPHKSFNILFSVFLL